MKIPFSIYFLALSSIAALAQGEPGPIHVPEVLGRGLGMVAPYTNRPADITLVPKGPAARHGRVWVQNNGLGLLLVGEVDGERPDFPRNKNLILAKDHVEVWLADGADPDLPPIGWGNQFDQITLPNGADSCAEWAKKVDTGSTQASSAVKKCRDWAQTQTRYRRFLKRLFARQWLVSPGYAEESFASPAYEEITAHFASDQPKSVEVPEPLKPRGKLQMWFSETTNPSGYTFVIMIPFDAFPPLAATKLQDLRLLVDVFNPPPPGRKAGSYSTSSLSRVYGTPETFNLLRLDPPHQFHVTPCDLPLTAKDKYGETHSGWIVPKNDPSYSWESEAFIVVNDGAGYQYEPQTLSPTARPIQYFWHGVAESEWLCGPQLSYRKGEQRQHFDVDVDQEGFDAHRLPSGELLIKVGPRVYNSAFGSGTCGACPRTELRILRLGTDMKIREVLRLGSIVDDGTGAAQDFAVSPDWTQVIQYDQDGYGEQGKAGAWSSTTWCFSESEYQKCDNKRDVKPPEPPVLKELRNPD